MTDRAPAHRPRRRRDRPRSMRAARSRQTLRTALALLASRLAGAPLGERPRGAAARARAARARPRRAGLARRSRRGRAARGRALPADRRSGGMTDKLEIKYTPRRVHRLRARRLPGQEARDPVPLQPGVALAHGRRRGRPAAAAGVEGAAPGAAAAPAADTSADAAERRAEGELLDPDPPRLRRPRAGRGGLDEQLRHRAGDRRDRGPAVSGRDRGRGQPRTGPSPSAPARPRPTVLFVWGRKRVLPVRIASLKIDESVYNNQLNPVRAEIEASLEVLGEAEARSDAAASSAALDHTHAGRRGSRASTTTTRPRRARLLPL